MSGLDPGFAISRVIAEIADMRQLIGCSKDSFDDADENSTTFLTNREADDIIRRLGGCLTLLCNVVSPDDHSLTVRQRAVEIANELALLHEV
jgi:hypothetical protein